MTIGSILHVAKRLGTTVLRRLGCIPADNELLAAMLAWMDTHKVLPPDIRAPASQASSDKLDIEIPPDALARSMTAPLSALPPLTHAILALHVYHAMRVVEISQHFGISDRRVRRHIRRATRLVAQTGRRRAARRL